MSSSGPSLDQVIQQVIAASQAGGEHAEKMKGLIQGVMNTPMASPAIQALGEGLTRVLEGKHSEEATSGLPTDVTALVNQVLQALGKPTSSNS